MSKDSFTYKICRSIADMLFPQEIKEYKENIYHQEKSRVINELREKDKSILKYKNMNSQLINENQKLKRELDVNSVSKQKEHANVNSKEASKDRDYYDRYFKD